MVAPLGGSSSVPSNTQTSPSIADATAEAKGSAQSSPGADPTSSFQSAKASDGEGFASVQVQGGQVLINRQVVGSTEDGEYALTVGDRTIAGSMGSLIDASVASAARAAVATTVVETSRVAVPTPEVGPLQAMDSCYTLQVFQRALVQGKSENDAQVAAQAYASHQVPGTRVETIRDGLSMALVSYDPRTNQCQVAFSTLDESTDPALTEGPGGAVNAAYAGAALSLVDRVSASVAALSNAAGKPVDVNLSGYSGGGTMATLAAAKWLEDDSLHPKSLYTFGSPPAGDQAFTRSLQGRAQASGLSIQRVVVEGDPVPQSFASDPRYSHLGNTTLVHLNGTAEINPPAEVLQEAPNEKDGQVLHNLSATYLPLTTVATARGSFVELPRFQAQGPNGLYDVFPYETPTDEASPFGEPIDAFRNGGVRGIDAILATIGQRGPDATGVDLNLLRVIGRNSSDYAVELFGNVGDGFGTDGRFNVIDGLGTFDTAFESELYGSDVVDRLKAPNIETSSLRLELDDFAISSIADFNKLYSEGELSPTATQSQVRAVDNATTYTVRNGDTLSGVATSILGDARDWARLYAYNADVIGADVNSIKPGMMLAKPPDDYQLPAATTNALYSAAAKVPGTGLTVPPSASDVFGMSQQWLRGMVEGTDGPSFQDLVSALTGSAPADLISGTGRPTPNARPSTVSLQYEDKAREAIANGEWSRAFMYVVRSAEEQVTESTGRKSFTGHHFADIITGLVTGATGVGREGEQVTGLQRAWEGGLALANLAPALKPAVVVAESRATSEVAVLVVKQLPKSQQPAAEGIDAVIKSLGPQVESKVAALAQKGEGAPTLAAQLNTALLGLGSDLAAIQAAVRRFFGAP